MDEEPVVRLDRVRRTYRTGNTVTVALDDVTVGFARGAFVAVMGPSGSGKTTLLQCAAGLDRPDSGQVQVDGIVLNGLGENRLSVVRRERMGFVFQAYNLVDSLTAEQNVGLPLRLAGRRPDRDAVRAALAKVGMADRASHLPSQLSGGQQQRVAIARALATRPRVLFADEPTGALDRGSGHEVLTELRRLVDREGQSTVMVTHDPVAAAHADRVVFVSDGRLAGELSKPTAHDVADAMAELEPDRKAAQR